ncbi:TPA: hypothetical protein LT059_004644 [Salmonella enterica subsp. enterica serovar Kodjovi]|nr:hypothetical protein [Salmonella enterica subsp. enterica serovar Kodjovi]
MLNTDERLYYSHAGETQRELLLQIYMEEEVNRKSTTPDTTFASRATVIATAVRDAYMVLLDVPLPQRGGDYDVALSRKIARNLKHFLATDDLAKLAGDVNQAE